MFDRPSSLSPFPIYLLPSIPFRRRKSSTDSDGSTSSTQYAAGELLGNYLTGHTSYLRCAKCAIDVGLTSQIISKGFTGRHGRAYLVSPSPVSAPPVFENSRASETSCLPNTKTDAPSSRQLVTGIHTVSDVRCAFCNSMLGWKYDDAEEESQRYKVGKYILETKLICSSSNWELDESETLPIKLTGHTTDAFEEKRPSALEFDSQDEDECEDLFAGIWSPSLAAKRRQGKTFTKAMAGMSSQSGLRHG